MFTDCGVATVLFRKLETSGGCDDAASIHLQEVSTDSHCRLPCSDQAEPLAGVETALRATKIFPCYTEFKNMLAACLAKKRNVFYLLTN